MNEGALGLIEVFGYLGAIEAADSALKAANVSLAGCEKVKGGLVTVKLIGDVAAVKASVDAGSLAAEKLGVLLSSHVIARADKAVLDVFIKKVNMAEIENFKEENSQTEELKSCEIDMEIIENKEIKPESNEDLMSDLEDKTVEELRRIARSLKLGTMTNKQIKFARKDKLLEEIRRFYQRRDK